MKIIWWSVINILFGCCDGLQIKAVEMLCICSYLRIFNITWLKVMQNCSCNLLLDVYILGQTKASRFRQVKPDLKGVLDFHTDRHVIYCTLNPYIIGIFSLRTKSIESTRGQWLNTTNSSTQPAVSIIM